MERPQAQKHPAPTASRPEGPHKQKAPAGSPTGAWGKSCFPSASRRGPPGQRPLRRFAAEQARFSCSARYHTSFQCTTNRRIGCTYLGPFAYQSSLSIIGSLLPNVPDETRCAKSVTLDPVVRRQRHSSSLPRPEGYVFSQFFPSDGMTDSSSTVPSSRQRAFTLYPSGCDRGT